MRAVKLVGRMNGSVIRHCFRRLLLSGKLAHTANYRRAFVSSGCWLFTVKRLGVDEGHSGLCFANPSYGLIRSTSCHKHFAIDSEGMV